MKKGFALPTVLIVSVVMIMVLAVSVSATATSRQSLLNQYYDQLAQAAGEAGTAYARACLAANGNVPTWSNASPLTPKTDCSGVSVGSYPNSVAAFKSDSTLSFNDIVSSFSVGLPSVDAEGRAVTIPNSGFVQLLRSSTAQVWKTYTQPNFQSAVVPDLCSANQVGAQNGWSKATSSAGSVANFGDTSAGWTSKQAGSSIDSGISYFRKDFNAPSDGTYNISALADNIAEVSVDNNYKLVASSSTSPTNGTVDLTTGCHYVIVKLANTDVSPSDAKFALSIKKQGSSNAIVVSDASWFVASGNSVGYSQNNYFDYGWATPRDLGIYSASPWTGGPTNWFAISGDYNARWINSSNYAAGSYPFNQYTYFRTVSSDLLKVSTPTQFKISAACDNACDIYVDGNRVMNNTDVWSTVANVTLTLSEGGHTVGVQLYNGGTSVNPSAFLFSMKNNATNQIVLDSNSSFWNASNTWYASPQTLNSTDETYLPTPYLTAPANILLVGGGGSGGGSTGGGGGGGGVQNLSNIPLTLGNYPVTVGSGGATPGNKAQGQNGANSVFYNYLALGGGGGGYSSGAAYLAGFIGGSGGGGQNYYGTGIAGTASLAGQGNDGGLLQSFVGTTGGGGAGAAGARPVVVNGGANGGAGISSTITGSTVYYGGGGGGAGSTAGSSGSGGIGGGGAGNELGTAGTANTGGGGGGGWSYASGNGGAGGSGVVIISYPTGSLTATGGTITTSGSNTIHTFTSSGVFVITAINTTTAARGVNLSPDLSTWTLTGGATYNTGTGELVLPTGGQATSPLIRVDQPALISLGGDFYAPGASTYYSPNGGNLVGAYYYLSDGVSPATNLGGYTTNGCSQSLSPLNTWVLNDLRCVFQGGPAVKYVKWNLQGSSTYTSVNLKVKNVKAVVSD